MQTFLKGHWDVQDLEPRGLGGSGEVRAELALASRSGQQHGGQGVALGASSIAQLPKHLFTFTIRTCHFASKKKERFDLNGTKENDGRKLLAMKGTN